MARCRSDAAATARRTPRFPKNGCRGTDRALLFNKALRDRFAPGKPIWLTETADAACGGNPWAVTFLDTFRYLDQLGRLAKAGVQVVMHNTLAASDYGMLDENTLQPRPNYWGALLWRRLMGPTVLDAGVPIQAGLHVYAHCQRGMPGGVSLLVINTDRTAPHALMLSGASLRYTLDAADLNDAEVRLNGSALRLDAGDRTAADLEGAPAPAGMATFDPATITFLAIPAATNSACRRSAMTGAFLAKAGQRGILIATKKCVLGRSPCIVTPFSCVRSLMALSGATSLAHAADSERCRELNRNFELSKPQITAIEVSLTLFSAADGNCVNLATQLLDQGASVDARDRIGARPLSHAARSGHLEMVDLLLARGAPIDARDLNGATALYYAAERGHASVVQRLIERGADVKLTGKSGVSPVAAAAYAGRDSIVGILLAHGADGNAPDDTGKPPVVYAAASGRLDIVKQLLTATESISTPAMPTILPC